MISMYEKEKKLKWFRFGQLIIMSKKETTEKKNGMLFHVHVVFEKKPFK